MTAILGTTNGPVKEIRKAEGRLVAGHARLLVDRLDAGRMSKGGVIIPEAMYEESVAVGRVVSVGATDEMHGPIGAEVGDIVHYHPVYVRIIFGKAKRMPPPTIIGTDGKPLDMIMQNEVLAIEKVEKS